MSQRKEQGSDAVAPSFGYSESLLQKRKPRTCETISATLGLSSASTRLLLEGKFPCRQKTAPLRTIPILGRRPPPCVMYSDASYEDGTQGVSRTHPPPRAGWILFQPQEEGHGSHPRSACTLELPWSLIDTWVPRVQQIFPAETFTVLAALWNERHALENRDVIWFCDDLGTVACMVKGSARPSDVNAVIGATHILAMRLRCRLWFEWVDSKANPSDGLSREGLACDVCKKMGWSPTMGVLPPTVPTAELLEWAMGTKL